MLSYVESFHHAQRSFLNKRQQEAALLLNQACRCIRTTNRAWRGGVKLEKRGGHEYKCEYEKQTWLHTCDLDGT
ncbi:hypothetical protein L208DRAFT_1402446 [Tricholoma matsutake]|nr:hypothetical protein L208DRAFT_1402446 [Tricholoma matsutake 945]